MVFMGSCYHALKQFKEKKKDAVGYPFDVNRLKASTDKVKNSQTRTSSLRIYKWTSLPRMAILRSGLPFLSSAGLAMQVQAVSESSRVK